MKLVIRLAEPQTEKERLFRVESEVHDYRNPGEAWMVLNGKEYKVEVHFDALEDPAPLLRRLP